MLFAEVDQSYNQPLIFKWCIILGACCYWGCILLFCQELSKAQCWTITWGTKWLCLLRPVTRRVSGVFDGIRLKQQGLLIRERWHTRSRRLVLHSYFFRAGEGCLFILLSKSMDLGFMCSFSRCHHPNCRSWESGVFRDINFLIVHVMWTLL